jgi:heme/copper-type cytochrome/quinol oxidase subunit 2
MGTVLPSDAPTRREDAMSDAVVITLTVVVLVGVTGYLFYTMISSILAEKRQSRLQKIWKNFGLSIALAVLFLVSWAGQAVAEWGTYRHEQLDHGEPVKIAEYVVHFGQSTLENWQSEFLQLFSFVVVSAILIHRGSAESRDSEDRIESKIDAISKRLDEAGIGDKASAKS